MCEHFLLLCVLYIQWPYEIDRRPYDMNFWLFRISVFFCLRELVVWVLTWHLQTLWSSLILIGTPRMTCRLRLELTGLGRKDR